MSLLQDTVPRELLSELKECGYEIEEHASGIWYIIGALPFRVQLVAFRKLSPQVHSALRVLTPRAERTDAESFILLANGLNDEGDRCHADAVLQVSIAANKLLYDTIREESGMCEALKELMKDEILRLEEQAIEQGMKRGMQQGMQQGMEKGRREGMLAGIRGLMSSMNLTADAAMAALGIPEADRKGFAAEL